VPGVLGEEDLHASRLTREVLDRARRLDGSLAERTHLPERLERRLAAPAGVLQLRRADRAREEGGLDRSPALVTALAPKIGYAEAAKLAKEAVEKNLSVRELLVQKGILKGKELDQVLDLRAMTDLGVRGLGGGG